MEVCSDVMKFPPGSPDVLMRRGQTGGRSDLYLSLPKSNKIVLESKWIDSLKKKSHSVLVICVCEKQTHTYTLSENIMPLATAVYLSVTIYCK